MTKEQVDILPPDKYCNFWRVLFCGDEIIVNSEDEAKELVKELEQGEN